MRLLENDILIRDAVEADAPQLAAWWNDGAVMAHAGFPNGLGITPQEVAEDIAQNGNSTGKLLMIAYCSVPIGEINYHDLGNQTAEIGIIICDPRYQDKGIGSVVLRMFLRELFQIGFTKIVLDTNLTNTRAQHVYEKLGFQKLGVRLDSWTDQLGQLQSAVDYELTKENFYT